KPSTTLIPSPSDDRERHEIAEVTLLSLVLHKSAKIYEEQENVVIVQEKILEEDVEKIVEGADEESYASEFADSVFLNDNDDSDNRIVPKSYKENMKTVDDDDGNEKEKNDDKKDDDNDDHTDHTLVKSQVTGSSETRKEKMQTLIPLPPRSYRANLSLDKTISQELTATVSPTPGTTSQGHSKPTSINTKDLLGSTAGISR
nr:hypothetical protein [Tanacetum cinerariifolium]